MNRLCNCLVRWLLRLVNVVVMIFSVKGIVSFGWLIYYGIVVIFINVINIWIW